MTTLKNNRTGIDRLRFLKMSVSFAALMSMPAYLRAASTDRWGTVLPTRRLGKTGLDVTMFGTGGGPLNADYGKTVSIIEAAIKGGCRFFETSRLYANGESERGFGKFLTPLYRRDIILMSKSLAADEETLNRDLDTSLELMKTNNIDIYLIHRIESVEDVENRLKGEVLDALVKAKEEGKIKHIGFSGHSDPAALNYFIDKNLPDLEVILIPVNVADPVRKSFILNTLPKANEKNLGVTGMKVYAGGGFFGRKIVWGIDVGKERERVIPEILSKREAQHFAYSLPLSATTIGCTEVSHVDENIANTLNYNGISESEYNELIERVTEVALNNTLEHYKTKD